MWATYNIDSFMLKQLQGLLSDSTGGGLAAQGFRVILMESEDVLTRQMKANIKLMYRQRFFLENLQPVVTGYEAATKGTIGLGSK